MAAINSRNLAVLLSTYDGPSLASKVLKHYSSPSSYEDPMSPYFIAAFKILLDSDLPSGCDDISEWTEYHVPRRKALLWASTNMQHFIYVKNHPAERQKMLHRALLQETAQINEEYKNGSLLLDEAVFYCVQLWVHQFAPLLSCEPDSLEIPGVSQEVAAWLANAVYPPNPVWPDLIKTLSYVFAKQATAQQINHLLSNYENYFLSSSEFTLPFSKEYQKRFLEGVLSPTFGYLSISWQRALLTSSLELPHFDIALVKDGLRYLTRLDELKIKSGIIKTQLVEIMRKQHHISETSPASKIQYRSREAQRRDAEAKDRNMQNIRAKNICSNSEILRYYSKYAGMKGDEIRLIVQNVMLDAFKNPVGSEYDLGLNGKFTEFHILIGNMFHCEPKSLQVNLEKFAGAGLKEKGFTYHIVNSEAELIQELAENSDAYDVLWLIASDYDRDFNSRVAAKDQLRVCQELATVVQRFHMQGKGILLFCDNEPFLLHSNLVLERLFGWKMTGNIPGQNILKNTFKAHQITTGLQQLYEGNTICYPKPNADLSCWEFILGSDNIHPAMLMHNFQKNKGRVVVDTGFTKLYLEWEKAGTKRYINNANVWLLGLDYRLDNNKPIRGPIFQIPYHWTPKFLTPAKVPKPFKARKVVWLLLDGSWSVTDEEFEALKKFSIEVSLLSSTKFRKFSKSN